MRKRRNKRLRKRGLSEVVTTLLIILLSLVVVGAVWVVVNNFIQTGSEQIELGKFTLDLQIKSVRVLGDDVTVTVVVRRTGKGELIGMNFIFSDGQNSEVIRRDTILEELDVETFVFTLAEISTSNLKDVSVAPIYELSSGKEEPGNVADMFNIKEGFPGTGDVVLEPQSNFEKMGYAGAGRVEYGPFSSGVPKLPEFKRAIVDPLDVLPGDNQTFTVHVYSPSGVINVTTTTELDNSTLDLDLQEIGAEDGNQIFSATWVVNDVHTTTYRTHITATDAEGNSNSITLTWTDSCQSQFSHGSPGVLTSSCSTGASNIVAGLDGGSLTINSGVTLTIDASATWGFNDGESITVNGAITVTGQISKGNLYYTDGDGDGRAPNTYLTIGSGGIRAKDAISTSDCHDGNQYVYDSSITTAKDADNDGYTITSGTGNCVGASGTVNTRTYYRDTSNALTWLTDGQRLGTSDCNDGNNAVQVNKYYDVDWDGYCSSGTPTYCVASGAGNPYRDSCTGYSDCLVSNANVYRNVGSLARDYDQDGYKSTVEGVGTKCVGASTTISGRTYYKNSVGAFSYIPNSQSIDDDCYDSSTDISNSALVHPGQTGWFSVPVGGSWWDYDCSGVDTKRWPTAGGTCEQCSSEMAFRGETPDWETLQEGDASDWTPLFSHGPGDCNPWNVGQIGWVSSTPACGVAASYVSNVGNCMLDDCPLYAYGCYTASRTQQCR